MVTPENLYISMKMKELFTGEHPSGVISRKLQAS
jgi:hypothetical protein